MLGLSHSFLHPFLHGSCDFGANLIGLQQTINCGDTSTENIDNKVACEFDNLIRYRGRVAYDGSRFRGWQVQAKGRTVQVSKIKHFILQAFYFERKKFQH